MLKREREVFQAQLDSEADVLKELEGQYQRALHDINERIMLLQSGDQTQSRVYQVEYQKTLKNQVSAILDKLHADEYSTLQQYLADAYQTGYAGTMYAIHGQGVPVIAPIDQAAAVKAIITDSKLSEPLYDALGLDMKAMKKAVRQEITRGISTGLLYDDIARNIRNVTGVPLSRAKTIARTDGHRIQQASADDARNAAKARGASVVKQWDATLDGSTRSSHRALDGQIREVGEPFEYGAKKAMYPGEFGDPAEDCNCRCCALTRARWALDEDELATMKERAEFFGLDKTESFAEFEKKYLKAAETVEKSGKSGIIKTDKQFGKKIGKHAVDYGLDPGNPDDRNKMLTMIDDICLTADEVAHGEWRGQSGAVKFYIKGSDVVVASAKDEFIKIMKVGVTNASVKNSRTK